MSAPYMVGLAGGSGSGKTTLVQGVAEALGRDRVAVLCHDAYYRDRGHLPSSEYAAIDYDVPSAFDQVLFRAHLERLRRGESVRPPRYCFATHRRLADDDVLHPRQVILVEGILLLHDPAVRSALDLKIYVDAPQTTRLARRIARDTSQRNRTVDSVIRQFTTMVSPAHREYVEPTKALADLVVLNVSRLPPVVEILVTVIRARLTKQELTSARAQSA